MEAVFVPACLVNTVKKSGVLAATGVVCPFLFSIVTKHHSKTMAGKLFAS